jgi:GTP-binding protein
MISIAIIGRPNVGKSTLFNRLTRTRNAIVSNHPGCTRDRQYGIAKINDQDVILIDTGGIGNTTKSIETLAAKQTDFAINDAQVIIFMVDARSGLTSNDEILVNKLRKLNKTILTVINKIDGQDLAMSCIDFYKLGFGINLPISAEHNIGIQILKDTIIKSLPKIKIQLLSPKTDIIKITLIGRPNVGKSTLINKIIGEERMITHHQPGTTRDSISIDFKRYNQDYILVDTAGIRRHSKINEKIEKLSIIKTIQAIATTDIVILLMDATENITDQDLKLSDIIRTEGKSLVIAINKWDVLQSSQKNKIKNELIHRLDFLNFVSINFISALHGTGIGNLFKAINKTHSSTFKKLSTPELNKILAKATHTYPPPLINGRGIKLLYAHTGHRIPPTIIIHGTRTNALPKNYHKYLEHFFRKELHLIGTPIDIVLKKST